MSGALGETIGLSARPGMRQLPGVAAREFTMPSGRAAGQRNPPRYLVCVERGLEYLAAGRLAEARALFDEAVKLRPAGAEARFGLGWTRANAGSDNDALASCDALLTRYGDDRRRSLRGYIAHTLIIKTDVLRNLDRCDEALAVVDDFLNAFVSDEPEFDESVAWGLVTKEELLAMLGRQAEALDVLDSFLDRFGNRDQPQLQSLIAFALRDRGVALGELGHSKEAIADFERLITGFGKARRGVVPEIVAWATVFKAIELNAMGEYNKAFAVLGSFLDGSEAEPPPPQDAIVQALVTKGIALAQLDRSDEALAVLDGFLDRFGNVQAPAVLELIVCALNTKGVVFDRGRRYDEALVVYDDALTRFDRPEYPWLRGRIAETIVNKANARAGLGYPDEALADFSAVIARFGNDNERPLRSAVARALVDSGKVLHELGRRDEALAKFDDVISRFGATLDDGVVVRCVAMSLFNRGFLLESSGQDEEALAAFNAVIDLPENPGLRVIVGRSYFEKGIALTKLERHAEAYEAYYDLLRYFGDVAELHEQITGTVTYFVDNNVAFGEAAAGEYHGFIGALRTALNHCDNDHLRAKIKGALEGVSAQLKDLLYGVSEIFGWPTTLTSTTDPALVEIDTLDYNNSMKDAETLEAFAARYGFKTVAELQTTIEEWRAAKTDFAKRENTAPAPAPSRLETAAAEITAPVALEWPSEKWKGSPEELSRKQHALISYLRRVWVPFIDSNNVIVTREILKDKDIGAAAALKGYLHRNTMPPDIRIFTDEQLKEHLSQRPVSANRLPSLAA